MGGRLEHLFLFICFQLFQVPVFAKSNQPMQCLFNSCYNLIFPGLGSSLVGSLGLKKTDVLMWQVQFTETQQARLGRVHAKKIGVTQSL